MNKYFVSYRYVIGYADSTGNRIYETNSSLINLDMNKISDIYDVCKMVLEQDLKHVQRQRTNFNEFDIEIINLNKV